MSKPQETLVQQIRERLDDSTQLDQSSLDRLADARRQALNSMPQQAAKHARRRIYWLSGAVTAGLVALVISIQMPRQAPNEPIELTELEWLLETDELEMLQRDLTFYQWAEEEAEAVSTKEASG